MKISDKLKIVKLSDIKPYMNNPKIHSGEQIAIIEDSIRNNDYLQPIILDKDNVIIAGHGRFQALRQIDPEQEIEVIDGSHLTSKQVKKFRIFDNKIAEGEWDYNKLESEIQDIYKDNDELQNVINEIGFDVDYIDNIVKGFNANILNQDDVSRIDEKKKVVCPKCGEEFEPS